MKSSPVVALKYARAFYSSVKAEDYDSSLSLLKDASEFMVLDEIKEHVFDPTISASTVYGLFSEYMKTADDLTMRFIELLIRKKRLALLPDIAMVFEELVDESRRMISVIVETPVDLTDKEFDELTDYIIKETGRKPAFKVEKDPSLIAGIILRYQDKVVDMSLSGRLNRMKLGLED